jgi:hypothetical protein
MSTYRDHQPDRGTARIHLTAADLDAVPVRIRELQAEGLDATAIRARLAEEFMPVSEAVVREVLAS